MKYNTRLKLFLFWESEEGWQQTILTMDARGHNYDQRKLNKGIAKWYKDQLGLTVPRNLIKQSIICKVVPFETSLEDFTKEQEEQLNRILLEMHYEDERTTGV